MRLIATIVCLFSLLSVWCSSKTDKSKEYSSVPLMGTRFLNFNVIIRVNQIEVARDKNVGKDERHLHTPAKVIEFRNAIEAGFPGAKVTWGFSWLALHDTTSDYKKIRELIVGYHYKYGDEMTFVPGGFFASAFNTTEQINKDVHEGLAKVSEIVGGGYRPNCVIAAFMSAKNQEYLVREEGIHVCQGNTFSQYDIDLQDGDGSISYPYYPSKEHFCKPAQGTHDFIDCVNLDGWTLDFMACRRAGYKDGFNSSMGVGPIETLLVYPDSTALKEILHTASIHFDNGFELNGFGWVVICWELSLPIETSRLTMTLSEIRKRWPETRLVTIGEFGLIWREHYKNNDSLNYRFVERGSGVGGSDVDKEIRWFMNKNFRLALLRNWKLNTPEEVIDFTRYDLTFREPEEMTRRWSILGDINQKQTRPQDKPIPLTIIPKEWKSIISIKHPYLF